MGIIIIIGQYIIDTTTREAIPDYFKQKVYVRDTRQLIRSMFELS